jgi:hypothetical protein
MFQKEKKIGSIDKILHRITRFKLIRIIGFIPNRIVHYTNMLLYQVSSGPNRVQSLKGKGSGKRCFIIGNGPSLTIEDLEKLNNEVTFGVNSLFNAYEKTNFRPTYYLATDHHFFANNKKQLEFLLKENKSVFLFRNNYKKYLGYQKNVIPFFQNYLYKLNPSSFRQKKVNSTPNKWVSMYFSVVGCAIEIAFYMGFNEINLIGVDFSQGRNLKQMHFYAENEDDLQTYTFFDKPLLSNYFALDRYAKEHGIRINNASRETYLDVFPLVCLDDLL